MPQYWILHKWAHLPRTWSPATDCKQHPLKSITSFTAVSKIKICLGLSLLPSKQRASSDTWVLRCLEPPSCNGHIEESWQLGSLQSECAACGDKRRSAEDETHWNSAELLALAATLPQSHRPMGSRKYSVPGHDSCYSCCWIAGFIPQTCTSFGWRTSMCVCVWN